MTDYTDEKLAHQIDHGMSLHSPNADSDQVIRYERLRTIFKETSHVVNMYCPPGRDKSLALTHLEDGLMRAIRAIAVGEA